MRCFAIVLLLSANLVWLPLSPLFAADYRDNAQGITSDILLTIQSTSKVRCQVILAHFVTRTLSVEQAGSDISLRLKRDDVTGSLAEQTSGRNMQVENILCGLQHRWQETTVGLPLSLVRSSTSRLFSAICTFNNRPLCTIEQPPVSSDP